MAQLPTVIKRDVRDAFDKPGSRLEQQLKDLRGTIGYPVRFTIDWALLWTECEAHFPDKATFLPTVVAHLTAFAEALAAKVDDESSSDWAEELLDKVGSVKEIRIDVQAASVSHTTASVTWSADPKTFVLTIPPKPSSSSSSTQLLPDLDRAFSPPSEQSKAEEEDDAPPAPILTPVSSWSMTSQLPTRSQADGGVPSSLPALATLARPDVLFSQSSPHIIHLQYDGGRILIQSTHQPSLKLIHDYFSKWSRADTQTREQVPLLRYTLVASFLGPTTTYDTLQVEPFSQVSARNGLILNPSVFESFIEAVLGYEPVPGRGNGVFWEFRRTTPFR